MKKLTGKKKCELRYDSCVLCGRETQEPFDREVSLRKYYIEGAGQLCPECYHRIYKEQGNER